MQVAKYKALDKSNWARQDVWAFKKYEKYRNSGEHDPNPFLDLMECMVMRSRCTAWMSRNVSGHLRHQIQSTAVTPDEQAQAAYFCADMAHDQQEYAEAASFAEDGLLINAEANSGITPMLHYLYGLVQHKMGRHLVARSQCARAEGFSKVS